MQHDEPVCLEDSFFVIDGYTPDISPSEGDLDETIFGLGAERFLPDSWKVLPFELLVEIFQHAITGPMALSPLELGRICRLWRNLAFSSCQLWGHIELELSPLRHRTQLFLLEQWLERAMDVSLSLVISSDMQRRRAKYHQLINIIGKKSTQISSLDLEFPGLFFSILSDSTILPFTAMTRLVLSLSDHSESFKSNGEPPMRTFEPSSQLTNATIRRFYVSSVSLPWAQLLHLQLETVAPYEICQVIFWSPNLQTLTVDNGVDATNRIEIDLPGTIIHPKLQRFSFSEPEGVTYTYTVAAFNKLRLLGLKAFTFVLGNRMSPPYREPFLFHPLFSASAFPLEELSIQWARIKEPDLLACLRLLPSLRVLILSNNIWYNVALGSEIFELMMLIPDGRRSILPNLRSLIFQGSEVSFSPDAIVELLESRWGPPILPERSSPRERCSALQMVAFHPKGLHWVITKTHQSMFDRWRVIGFSVAISSAHDARH